jgi:mannonate dehydratase
MVYINRREAVKNLGGMAGGFAAVMAGGDSFWEEFGRPEPAEFAQSEVRRGLPPVKITDVKVIRTQVGRSQFLNVKVLTDEPGLYGVGDGNHLERVSIVASHIEQFLKPMVVGRNVDEIEDIWQTAFTATYWRSAVDANNAIAAIDGALWDIMGKRAGMPVYDLLGGRVRAGTRMFTGASTRSLEDLEDSIREGMERGYQHFRFRGVRDPDSPVTEMNAEAASAAATALDRGVELPRFSKTTDAYFIHSLERAFEHVRKTIGWDIELGSDVHNNVTPAGGLILAKALEPYRPWFLEDLFTVDDWGWYERVRETSAVGLAHGETFTHRLEWLPLVENHLIDYVRAHISAIGGLNMARKLAMLCEFFNVRTAWHGPSNVSPIGHAINMHLDLACYNFGIGEGGNFNDQLRELYPGLPEIRNGVRYPANDLPGLGVDIDEEVAAKYPPQDPGGNRGARSIDGEPRRP